MITPPLIIIGVLILYLISVVNVLREYERGVIFRLGRLLPKAKGPGIILVFWPIDRMERVSLRLVTMDVPAQDVITRDNVTVITVAIHGPPGSPKRDHEAGGCDQTDVEEDAGTERHEQQPPI